MILRSLLITLALVAVAATAWGQQVDGSLEARILGPSGEPLIDVRLVASGPNLQGTRTAITGRDGFARLPALPVGTYTLSISHIAYQGVTFQEVTIELGKTTQIGEVRLATAVHELPKMVVNSQKPMIDPTTTTLRTTLSAATIEALPTDRNFRSLVALAPEANVSFAGDDVNIAGSTGEGNYYYIDGTDATDPGAAGTSVNLPYNFIQAIEIKTGGYEAEYGRALGGIVNVITPSGGNDTRRETFGYFTNHRLVSAPKNSLLEVTNGQFSSYDFGGTYAGPLMRDKLWFFAAYNPTSDDRDAQVPGIAIQQDRRRTQRFAGKLTWRASDRTNMNLTVLGDPSTHRAIGVPFNLASPPDLVANADAVTGDVREGGYNVSVNGMHQLRHNVLLKGAVSSVHNRTWVSPVSARGSAEPFYNDLEANSVSGGYGIEHKNHQDRTGARASAAVFLGRHAWKTGVEYTDNSITDDIQFGAGRAHGGFIYRSSDSAFTWFQGYGVGTVHMRLPTVYSEDSWRATDRLRINAGLRWDGNYLVNSAGSTALSITDGTQPRVGFTFEPGEIGTQKVFGSYGRYFEQLPTGSPGYYFFDSIQLYIAYDHDPLVDPSGGDTTALLPSPPQAQRIHGERFDEFVLGYERVWDSRFKTGVKGRMRNLGEVIEDGFSPSAGRFVIGNPGTGEMSEFPKATQRYSALEFTLESPSGGRSEFLASYVLSRNVGNYGGLVSGNAGPQFDFIETTVNADGYLPNDRRHVIKLHGAFRSGFGLTTGLTGIWASGTPLNELGGIAGLPYTSFLRARGSAGRTPSLWDLNMRLTYDLFREQESFKPKLTLDLFHLFSPRKPILLDERHYLGADDTGAQVGLNSNYLEPVLYQPAFSARLGAVVDF